MIYLAIFYFSSNLWVVLADIYTEHHIHGRYATYYLLDILIVLIIGMPVTVWGILTEK